MDKFIRQADERQLMKGTVVYVQGEASLKNLFTGKAKSTECTAFLTSKRFVATKKRRFFPFGPLIWLFIVLRKRRIVFQIPLDSFATIMRDKTAKDRLLFKASDGSEYRVVWTGFFAKPEPWVEAITAAVVAARPGYTSRISGDSVEFVKAS